MKTAFQRIRNVFIPMLWSLLLMTGILMAVTSPAAALDCSSAANDPNNKVTCVSPTGDQIDPALSKNTCANLNNCDLITRYINPAIAFLTAFIGLAVTIAIIYGGVEYGSSGGDPSKAAAAKNRIRNALFVLVAYFFLYEFLNFIIPGGVKV